MLSGNIRPNAVTKLSAFGLDGLVDFEVGGTALMTRSAPTSWPWPSAVVLPNLRDTLAVIDAVTSLAA